MPPRLMMERSHGKPYTESYDTYKRGNALAYLIITTNLKEGPLKRLVELVDVEKAEYTRMDLEDQYGPEP